MTAVLALILDSYRQINAKRLFWFVLVISGLIVAGVAGVGLTADGITIFGWHVPYEFGTNLYTPASFYKLIYVTLGIRLWLSWVAMVLAVISTAGVIPDFLASGSVDLYLSRPVGRLRIFLVKYFCGLLFVFFQVGVFSVASFLVIGLRGGAWEPGLLLAVPLVTLMFSYLFGFCALIGVITRSTVAAMLLTLVFWLLISGLQNTEKVLLVGQVASQQNAQRLDRAIAQTELELKAPPTTSPSAAPPANSTGDTWMSGWTSGLLSLLGPQRQSGRQELENRLADLRTQRSQITDFSSFYQAVHLIDAPFPKTSETVALLERDLLSVANLPQSVTEDDTTVVQPSFRQRRRDRLYAAAYVDREFRQRSAWWIIGSSVAFEAVVVGLAAGLFCRHDY